MSSRSKFGATKGSNYNQSFGPVAGLQQAMDEPGIDPSFSRHFDLASGALMAGSGGDQAAELPYSQTTAGVLGTRNLRTANPIFYARHFDPHGQVNNIANDPGSSFNTNPDIPGNTERMQSQVPQASRTAVIGGLRNYMRGMGW